MLLVGSEKASSGLRLMEVADAFPSICRSLHRVNEGIIGVNFGSPVAGIYIFTIVLSERVENKSSSLGSSFIRGAITLGVTYGPWPSSRSLILICHTCWAVNTPAWGWGWGVGLGGGK